ncbi:hypothetical protein FA95DRAFT_1535295 [Auriscalpium vulgare]|uniref:Uncharacterized protein n=1 Tax=Auriscalpium vulgare TaxID=40419 RepID=A0ACB8S465_9AGAM|nr:hypothetical protein FA95DRAFT_1535295 [Auriscalpium vulgare]
MVSSLLVEALASPTDLLDSLYESQDASNLSNFPRTVANHFSDIFKSDEAFAEVASIPSLSPSSRHKDRALVRFRALVQDTSPAPEMYLSRLKTGKLGGWGLFDISEDIGKQEDISYDDLRDCTVLWAVNVPGESGWYTTTLDNAPSQVTSQAAPPRPYKYPVPHESHIGVQIKIYDSSGNDAPKTAEVVNFVGILTTEALHTESDATIDVPTLHVLFTRPHKLEPITLGLGDSADESLREELIGWIADEALGGDRDAAEWFLLASLARVQSRSRSLNPPSLTLSHFPSPTADITIPTVSHILAALHPLAVTLPLSLDFLNQVPFAPESKQEDLHSGVLQLAHGTTVLITESGVQEGKLVERGVLNVRTVQDVMTLQTLAYKFPYSEFSFPTDLTFVVLAQGSKSAFWKTDIILPLAPGPSFDFYKAKVDLKMPSSDKLTAFRSLIVGAKTGKIDLTEAASEYIQSDFVQERKADSSVTSEDLKQTLTVARLLGISLREKEVTVDIWNRAKELDKRRKARFM